MIYLVTKNHRQEFALINLIGVFFPGQEVEVLGERSEGSEEGILIESIFLKDRLSILTNIYKDGKILESNRERLEDIDIGIRDEKRRLSLGIRKSLYRALDHISPRESPWGILTGIRPLKILHELMDGDISEPRIRRILAEEYRIYPEKIDLLLDIGVLQRKYISSGGDKYSIYIAIAFCPSKCNYCSFPSVAIDGYRDQVEDYVDRVIYELEKTKELMEGRELNTVYIGGGTPTAIPREELEKIIQTVNRLFASGNIREFTVEAGRPDTIDRDYLLMLKKNGVGRISINPQTMNDKTLKKIGRRHSVEDIRRTYRLAEEIGFNSINMDLIIGLEDEDEEDMERTIREIRRLDPDNLTLHSLALKTKAKLEEEDLDYSLKRQESLKNMFHMLMEYGKEMDLKPYYLYRQKKILGNLENIGLAKKDKECIYNIVMMEEKETIIGIGMGAVSKIYDPKRDRIQRVPNFKSLHEYINRVDELVERKEKAFENL